MIRLLITAMLLASFAQADTMRDLRKHEKLCLKGKPRSCVRAAMYYKMEDKNHFIETLRESEKKALFFAKKGCEMNDAEACMRAGNYLKTDFMLIGEPVYNPKEAKKFLKKGCRLGSNLACMMLRS